jgi:hypothetical protein
MGRSRNRKWRARVRRWLVASTVIEKDRLQRLFGRHKKFTIRER